MNGKKVLVTGASRGIGFAIAKAVADKGGTVVITGRNEKTLAGAAERIGKNVIPMVFDVSELDQIESKINEAAKRMGGLDAVVNNAGVFSTNCNEWNPEELLNYSIEEWNKLITTNVSALFFSMQATVKYMLAHEIKGNILNITSVAGYEPAFGGYGASKTAATGLTRGWGKMYASKGITINGIAPGPVATEMNNWHEGDSMEHPRIPYGRFATAEEIAELAMYLLSDSAKMVCGETVVFDGAYMIR